MSRDYYIFFIVPILKTENTFIFVVLFVVAIAEAVVIGDIY